MGDARIGRFLLLVAPLLFGLLAMHAFVTPTVAADGGHRPAGHGTAPATASVVSGVEQARTAPMVHTAPARRTVTDGSVPAAPVVTGADHGSAVPGAAVPDGVPSGHHGVDHLVHLCLAVLAAVGLAVATVWVLLGGVGPSVAAPAVRRVRSAPAGRPPPVPRRLALLCVMRN